MTDEPPKNPAADIRVLACLDQSAVASIVAHRAGRLARQLRAPLEAVHVATPLGRRSSKQAQEALLQGFRLAETFGAQSRTLNGDDAAAEIVRYAQSQGVTHIVLGASSRPLWIELFSGSLLRRLLRRAGEIAVEVCPRDPKNTLSLIAEIRPPPLGDPISYFIAASFVAVATVLALPLDRATALPNISLVYVLAVIAAAARYGAAVAVFTALISALAYNYFLTEPYFTFRIADPRNVWAVFFFLAVGVAVSGVAAHARAQTLIARRQARESAELQALARILLEAEHQTDIAASTAETISKLLYARAVVLTSRHGVLEIIAEAPGPEMLGGDDMAAARWAYENRREAGHGADTLEQARWLFVPVPGEKGFLGVVGVRPFDDALRLDPEQRRLLDLIAVQAGAAFDRERFARAAAEARVDADSERQKGLLLSSMSHDLRTPLATIRGAIESVLNYGDRHSPETQRTLLQDAAKEARKLSGFVQNLLDMARIDTGGLRATCEHVDVANVVEAAIERVQPALEGHVVSRDLATGLYAHADPALTERALANILENAAKYGPTHGTVLVRAYREDDSTVIEVVDEGPGFTEEARGRMFDKFAHLGQGDGRPPGTGLGLAMAQGFIDAQGGTIEAENRSDRSGARVRIVLRTEQN